MSVFVNFNYSKESNTSWDIERICKWLLGICQSVKRLDTNTVLYAENFQFVGKLLILDVVNSTAHTLMQKNMHGDNVKIKSLKNLLEKKMYQK